MTCRATCLGTGCPSRCVTTAVDQGVSGVARVAGLVSRYGSVNIGILKPSIGRDGLGFSIGCRNSVHFKLKTVGKMKRSTIRDVLRREQGGNRFGGVFSFIRHMGLSTYGHGGVRGLTLTNKFSDFSNVGHRSFFIGGTGSRSFSSVLIHCNGGCRLSGTTTTGSLFKKRRTMRITAPRVIPTPS